MFRNPDGIDVHRGVHHLAVELDPGFEFHGPANHVRRRCRLDGIQRVHDEGEPIQPVLLEHVLANALVSTHLANRFELSGGHGLGGPAVPPEWLITSSDGMPEPETSFC